MSAPSRLAQTLPARLFGEIRVVYATDVGPDDDRFRAWHAIETLCDGEWTEIVTVPHSDLLHRDDARSLAEFLADALEQAPRAARARILLLLGQRIEASRKP